MGTIWNPCLLWQSHSLKWSMTRESTPMKPFLPHKTWIYSWLRKVWSQSLVYFWPQIHWLIRRGFHLDKRQKTQPRCDRRKVVSNLNIVKHCQCRICGSWLSVGPIYLLVITLTTPLNSVFIKARPCSTARCYSTRFDRRFYSDWSRREVPFIECISLRTAQKSEWSNSINLSAHHCTTKKFQGRCILSWQSQLRLAHLMKLTQQRRSFPGYYSQRDLTDLGEFHLWSSQLSRWWMWGRRGLWSQTRCHLSFLLFALDRCTSDCGFLAGK